ncbi:hypothetical protein Droror1_Dr00013469 [Drosera rotundifolia]
MAEAHAAPPSILSDFGKTGESVSRSFVWNHAAPFEDNWCDSCWFVGLPEVILLVAYLGRYAVEFDYPGGLTPKERLVRARTTRGLELELLFRVRIEPGVRSVANVRVACAGQSTGRG